MAAKNMQVLLANRPTGWAKESDFRIVETGIPAPGDGQVRSRTSISRSIPICAGA